MQLIHHGLHIAFDDSWWIEAQMVGFLPNTKCYRTDHPNAKEILILDVAPVQCAPGVKLFNDSSGEEISARERVVRILSGFRRADVIPPVEITEDQSENIVTN